MFSKSATMQGIPLLSWTVYTNMQGIPLLLWTVYTNMQGIPLLYERSTAMQGILLLLWTIYTNILGIPLLYERSTTMQGILLLLRTIYWYKRARNTVTVWKIYNHARNSYCNKWSTTTQEALSLPWKILNTAWNVVALWPTYSHTGTVAAAVKMLQLSRGCSLVM